MANPLDTQPGLRTGGGPHRFRPIGGSRLLRSIPCTANVASVVSSPGGNHAYVERRLADCPTIELFGPRGDWQLEMETFAGGFGSGGNLIFGDSRMAAYENHRGRCETIGRPPVQRCGGRGR